MTLEQQWGDIEETLGDWDILPLWLRVVIILALPVSLLMALLFI